MTAPDPPHAGSVEGYLEMAGKKPGEKIRGEIEARSREA